MTERAALEAFLQRETGLVMGRGGMRRSVDRFLDARRRALGLRDVDAYLRSLCVHGSDELGRLVEAVTVPHSWFYRDPEQWVTIEGWIRAHGRGRPLAAWVPACATGEDAYTLALLAWRAATPVRVLGTDIHGTALQAARAGRYGDWSLRELPPSLRQGLCEGNAGRWEVRSEVRSLVTWMHHNLMHAPPPSPTGAGWDLVLCRNVLFYFSQPTATEVVRRLAGALAQQGRLVLGASDLLHSVPAGCRTHRVAHRTVIERGDPIAPAAPGKGGPTPRRAPAPPPPAPALPRRPSMRPPSAPPCDPALRAVEHDPLDPVARLQAGIALHAKGDAASAITELRAALFLSPSLWPAAVYLGLAHERAGHPEEAARCFARAVAEGMPRTALHALPEELIAYCDELAALARAKSRRKIA